ncbi:TPA: MoxR family ATPase [Candidatus Woesearchaeota archaeon]|nr:MoxR family ATPase [Candidatus Woesearchaeota archaeon]HII69578.1 MoxR family ATPase [Candidatus Woesearchaeota archaeon]
MDKKKVTQHYRKLLSLEQELSKAVVGQHTVMRGLIRGLLANGHVFLEGVPGVAKTLIIRTLAQATGCKFSRIQFTVDLLPTDITGITGYQQGKGFYVVKGPIFANFVIADEINRAPAKTQSALLEAMQEKQVTIGKETFRLPEPFFVMATQNPIESGGTYPLPEAQIDRFLFKVNMGYPKPEVEKDILERNISLGKFEDFRVKAVLTQRKILDLQKFVKEIYVKDAIKEYIVEIVHATRNAQEYGLKLGKYIEWGASPRASISLFIAAKAEALLSNSAYVTPQHVKDIAHDVMRHRIILNYEGQAEQVKSDDIITEVLAKIPVP